MTPPTERLWRVFPWDPRAEAGESFSPAHTQVLQGKGRFDLPGVRGGVIYFAENAEHAIAEAIQHYRGQELNDADFLIRGRRLALVAATLAEPDRTNVIDLCDPAVLVHLRVRPDETASRERRVTQRIASAVYADGGAGLRWWSALFGDWHTVVLFRDRIREPISYEDPEAITLAHAALHEAARAIGVRIAAH